MYSIPFHPNPAVQPLLSRQSDARPSARIRQFEPPGDKTLEDATGVVFPRRGFNLPQRHIPVAAERILVPEGIVEVLEILEGARGVQVRGQVGHDAVGQVAGPGVGPGPVPGNVEQEHDVVVLVAVEPQDVAAALEAVLGEDARQGLELDRGVDEEGILLVEVQFVVYDFYDMLHYGEVVGEGEGGVEVAFVTVSYGTKFFLWIRELLT